ncbi:hypothetical protein METP2_02850 [Methanosarcinales archaeon]|nr:hypothetical protein METP2_02850 [Methanosarcinales archaeon]
MSDLTYTVSMPFKRKGKDALKDMEFILALSLDLKWFNPEQAKNILNDAQNSGLLIREGEFVHPSFDISKIEIPSGWKPVIAENKTIPVIAENKTIPVIAENKTIFDRIIDRIIQGTGIEKRKVIAMINKKQEEFAKQVLIEVSAILIAVENGVMVDDLIDEEYAALTTLSSS